MTKNTQLALFEVKGLLEGMVNVIITDRKEQLVNARELHEALEVKTRFDMWIKRRIEQVGLEENIDYFSTTKIVRIEGTNISKETSEYYFRLDAAKEVAMMENNEMGRKFRKYFIEMERQAIRFLGKEVRRSLTDTIRDHWQPKVPAQYGLFTNELIYKPLFGTTSKKLIKNRNISGSLRDGLSKEELKMVEKAEQGASTLIDFGFEYKEVKARMNQKFGGMLVD
ncbi:antA/AntB antirepressor family protein [Oceanobacillus longus]|uniref:AntA/AntB antirepressor family protein n=1 Tax=Oceanobacillus longus TaxID=930120 RepID=A0ABV8GS79_9BACI